MSIKLTAILARASVLACALAFFLTGCGNYRSSIPDMPVYVRRHLPTIQCLSPSDSWSIVKPAIAADATGYGGILLVCAFDAQYYAFDLACPNEAEASKRLELPDESLNARCPYCGEVYQLGFGQGTPSMGISDEPLKRYRCTLSADGYIVISQ